MLLANNAPSTSEPAAPRPRANISNVVRTILAFGALSLALLYSLCVFAITRDRRRAVNRMAGLWTNLGGAAAGLRLDIKGAEYVDEARPAVFIFNHRSAADILIMTMLLRRDLTGIAKKELRLNPILAPAFMFAGVVFIDRFHLEHAVRALQPATDTLRSGISIAIAPEGTRSVENPIGPFKKGAFRLSMAAGAPIVPIVIHNSEDVLPRKALILRPATVRITVHPPISTATWTAENLGARISEVHNLYLKTLAGSETRDEATPRDGAGVSRET